MPATKRGIYHNLKESKYVVSNSEITFFLSSELYLNKFLEGYQENRIKTAKRMDVFFNTDTLADIQFYKCIEKRGFYCWLKGVELTWHDLHAYALRKMTEKNTLDWQRIAKPKLGERLKTMGSIQKMK